LAFCGKIKQIFTKQANKMIAIFGAVIGFLFSLGMGIYIIKNAREFGESLFHATPDIFNLSFYVWAIRFCGIWAIGMAIFCLFFISQTVMNL
jgi:hypothetical protein